MFEINRFRFGETDHQDRWTFYLYLALEQFPESLRDQMKTKVTFLTSGSRIETLPDDSFINTLDWHCGITYAAKETKDETPLTLYKYGCDYQHLWDEGKLYSAKELEVDAKACIDSLYIRCPEIKSANKIWEEFKERFPKDSTYRRFNFNGQPIEDI
jgi:hypothetical protein